MVFLYSHWLSLPLYKRVEIAGMFGIAKVRPTHVSNNQIADDGYNVADIEGAITVESLQAKLDSKEKDIATLWAALLASLEPKVEQPEEPKIGILPAEEAKTFNEEFEKRTGKKTPEIEVIKKPIKKVTKRANAKTTKKK